MCRQRALTVADDVAGGTCTVAVTAVTPDEWAFDRTAVVGIPAEVYCAYLT